MNNLLREIKKSQTNILTEIYLMRKELKTWREIITYANFHPRSVDKCFKQEIDISKYSTIGDFLQRKKLTHIDSEVFKKFALVLARQIDSQLIYSQIQNQKNYLFPTLILEKALIFYEDRN